jgi:RHS repeat-associated protein
VPWLFVLLPLLTWLGARQRAKHAGARFSASLVTALFLLCGACAAQDGPPPILDGTIQTLGEADELFFDDAIGSLTEQTTGTGTQKATFAAFPFGLTRYDTSGETRKYANSPRDEAVGLDQMGARSYAPDLGVWTSTDPLRVDAPERGLHASFAADHAYAYAALTPIVASDPDGRDPVPGWGTAVMGFAYGFLQGATPGGMLTTLLPLPEGANNGTFQYWQGAGQMLGGAAGVFGGVGTAATGGILTTSGVGAVVGAPVMVVSAAEVANGLVAIGAGYQNMAQGVAKREAEAAKPPDLPSAKHDTVKTSPGLGKGTSDGPRAGKAFTPRGKAQIDAENAARNGGANRCEKCGVKVVPGKKSTEGITPPSNERQRDHIIPRSKGGDGDPCNGQILCRKHNLEKSNK